MPFASGLVRRISLAALGLSVASLTFGVACLASTWTNEPAVLRIEGLWLGQLWLLAALGAVFAHVYCAETSAADDECILSGVAFAGLGLVGLAACGLALAVSLPDAQPAMAGFALNLCIGLVCLLAAWRFALLPWLRTRPTARAPGPPVDVMPTPAAPAVSVSMPTPLSVSMPTPLSVSMPTPLSVSMPTPLSVSMPTPAAPAFSVPVSTFAPGAPAPSTPTAVADKEPANRRLETLLGWFTNWIDSLE